VTGSQKGVMILDRWFVLHVPSTRQSLRAFNAFPNARTSPGDRGEPEQSKGLSVSACQETRVPMFRV
jgi:hypothetical protein